MLKEVNGLLTAVQRAAWDLRELAEDVTRLRGRGARLSATGWTLAQLAADYRAYAIYAAFLSERKRAAILERIHQRSAGKFHRASVEHMGAFLKVGQLLSARPDLLPPAWIDALAPLQDCAPAEPFETVRELIDLDRFASFDQTPMAAASIGQVHRATLHDGREVAVKLQRPGVAELIDDDLRLMALFLEAMEGVLPAIDRDTIVAEITRMVRGELDYAAEACAMEETADFLRGMPGVQVPRPLFRHCSDRVITAELCPGEKITTALDRLAAAGDRATLSSILGTLLEVYLRQILERGVFQADPHPGNFLVTPDGKLALLDFGCTRALSAEMRTGLMGLLRASLLGDRAALGAQLAALGFATRSGSPDTLLLFADAFTAAFRKGALSGTFSWPTRAELFAQAGALLEQTARDPVVRIPAEFVMIGRVFGTIGGLFQHYRPDINYAARVLPHLVAV